MSGDDPLAQRWNDSPSSLPQSSHRCRYGTSVPFLGSWCLFLDFLIWIALLGLIAFLGCKWFFAQPSPKSGIATLPHPSPVLHPPSYWNSRLKPCEPNDDYELESLKTPNRHMDPYLNMTSLEKSHVALDPSFQAHCTSPPPAWIKNCHRGPGVEVTPGTRDSPDPTLNRPHSISVWPPSPRDSLMGSQSRERDAVDLLSPPPVYQPRPGQDAR